MIDRLIYGGFKMILKKFYVIICCIICICYIPIVSSSMNVVDYLDQQQTYWNGPIAGVQYPCQLAQSFKPAVNVLTRISLYGVRNESSPNNLKISIRNTLDGQDLTSTIVNSSKINKFYPDWFEVDFQNISVIPESTYYIVWTTTSGNEPDSYFWWCYVKLNPGDDVYSRGSQWLYCYYTWTEQELADFCFKTYGYSIPSVTITSPIGDSSVYGNVSIQGTAEDEDGVVQKVEIKIDDGSWINANGKTNWNYDWDTNDVVNGYHVIYARSYDGESYSDEASVGVYVTNTELLIVDVDGGLYSKSIDIQNIGDIDANNVHISILIKGGFFNRINVEDSEIISVIESDSIYTFNINEEIFGFGKIVLTISVYANNANMVAKEFNGVILGPLIIIL